MARRKKGPISRSFKREVAIEYVQGGVTMEQLAIKYNLPSIQSVANWKRCLLTPDEIKNKCLTLPPESKQEDVKSVEKSSVVTNQAEIMSNEEEPASGLMIDVLEKRILELEKKLERSEMKRKALDTLIDIAEEQGISIRKKSGAKQ
jgi:transposase-like protein